MRDPKISMSKVFENRGWSSLAMSLPVSITVISRVLVFEVNLIRKFNRIV
jgi:hypothetical protein